MEQLEVVASRIFSVEDILADQTYHERGDIITVDDADLGPVRMQGVIPTLTNHPGTVWRTGPRSRRGQRSGLQGVPRPDRG